MPKAIEMCGDRVPNLRLLAAQSLGKCGASSTGYLEPAFVTSQVKPALVLLGDDADMDVSSSAKEALERL